MIKGLQGKLSPLLVAVGGASLLTLVAPWLFKWAGASVAMRVGVLFIGLNMSFAWWVGSRINRGQLRWWTSMILPLLFGLMVALRFAQYNYWFMAIYWVLTMLAATKD